jgi:hypothetical protein
VRCVLSVFQFNSNGTMLWCVVQMGILTGSNFECFGRISKGFTRGLFELGFYQFERQTTETTIYGLKSSFQLIFLQVFSLTRLCLSKHS